MTQVEAFSAFQAQLQVGDRVRHMADGALGTVEAVECRGPYNVYCKFDGEKSSCPVYKRNLIPTWWKVHQSSNSRVTK